jgi:hypothetical protein
MDKYSYLYINKDIKLIIYFLFGITLKQSYILKIKINGYFIKILSFLIKKIFFNIWKIILYSNNMGILYFLVK